MSDLSASEALQRAARGELDARSLWFILTDVMSAVERIRRRFEKSAERAPAQAGRAREAFKRHRRLLDEACRRVNGPPEELRRLSSELQAAGGELDRSLTEHREAVLTAMGPTRLAGVNAVLRSIEQNRPPAAVGACLAQERKRLEQALSAPHLPEDVADALAEMSRHVDEMLLHTGSTADPAFRSLAQSYLRAALAAQETFARAEAEAALSRGPTPNSSLNRLVHLARQGQPGNPEEALGEIAALRNQLASVARTLPSARVQSLAARLEEIFDRLEEAIEALCREPSGWDAHLREIMETFQALGATGRELHEVSQTEGKVPCAHCGQLNRSDFAACSKCGAVLPRVAGVARSFLDIREASGQSPPMTQNLKRMLDAIAAFESGEIDRARFQEQVAWFRGLLARALELWPVGQQPPPEYLEALQDIEASLSFFEQADGSGAMLDSGRALLVKGASRALSS